MTAYSHHTRYTNIKSIIPSSTNAILAIKYAKLKFLKPKYITSGKPNIIESMPMGNMNIDIR
jgi:hypothetical protein